MNQHLQSILNSIQQSTHLSEEEKNELIKAVKDTDKEIAITEFKLDRTEKVKRTTAILLEETIAELEQKRKAVEEQNHELEIEAALEKVRSRSLAMQKSEELNDVVTVLFERLKELQFPVTAVGIHTFLEGSKDLTIYVCGDIGNGLAINNYLLPYFNHPIANDLYNVHEKGLDFFVGNYSAEEKNSFYKYVFEHSALRDLPDPVKNMIFQSQSYSITIVPVKNSVISVNDFEGKSLSEREIDIIKRFAKVFEQAYTRFLDLQKAEAQAKESQIQLALERVRARTMAMQKSDELSEAVYILFQQFRELGENPDQATIGVVNEKEQVIEYWVTMYGNQMNKVFRFPIDEPNVTNKIYKAWKENKKSLVIGLSGKELLEFMAYRAGMGGAAVNPNEKRRIINVAFFSKGLLNVQSTKERSGESVKLLERFASVFEQTFTRFLDLQKAEAQAREAQIEGALEKVRSSSLAMHRSDEMQAVVNTVIDQLQKLNIVLDTTNILIFNNQKKFIEYWTGSNSTGAQLTTSWRVPYFNFSYYKAIHQAHVEGKEIFTGNYSFKEKNILFKHLFANTDFKNLNAERKKFILKSPRATIVAAIAKDTAIQVISYTRESFSEVEIELLKRFSKVFNQAYTRFLDLQKAEAQARESQIQLAMERVRARSLAMHHTSELQDVVNILAQQLHNMGMDINGGVFITINDEVGENFPLWASSGAADYIQKAVVPFFDKPIYTHLRDAIKKRNNFFEETYSKKEKDEMFKHLFRYAPWNSQPEKRKKELLSREGGLTRLAAIFRHTCIAFTNHNGKMFLEEEKEILKRFGNVFEQTYIRFLDLQKAEAQAREAQIEAALERVRAKAMAMHKSDDIAITASAAFEELKKLGINSIRCGVGLFFKDSKDAQVYAATQTGEDKIKTLIKNRRMDEHPALVKQFESWEKQEDHEQVLTGEELKSYYNKSFFQASGVKASSNYHNQSEYGYYFAFRDGLFYSWSVQPYTNNEKDILNRFRSIIALTFRRFLDLQKAEAQAREAQIEAALERVRSKTMAMHNSQDVAETVGSLFDELIKLGFEKTSRCGIGIMHENEKMETWTARSGTNGNIDLIVGRLDMSQHSLLQGAYNGWKNKKDLFSYELRGNDLVNYYTILNNNPDYPIKYDISGLPSKIFHNDFYFPEGVLYAFSFEQLSDEAVKIFKRFAAVFGQTYRRYLDLLKAEAQTRESQIQLALERVRARTMAMHNSNELGEVAVLLFEQVRNLGIENYASGFNIWDKEQKNVVSWMSNPTNTINPPFEMPIHSFAQHEKIYKAWKKHEVFLEDDITGKSLVKHYQFLRSFPLLDAAFKKSEAAGIKTPNRQVHNIAFFSKGYLLFITLEPCPQLRDIFIRFAQVFEQTYTRFLDLQKAEAQAREAQIEAALERVRSRSMAMHKSDELKEVIRLVLEQFVQLKINAQHAGFYIDYKNQDDMHIWLADPNLEPFFAIIPYFDAPTWNSFLDAKAKGIPLHTDLLNFKEKNKFYKNLFKLFKIPEEAKEFYMQCKGLAVSTVLLENVGLYIENFDAIPYSEEENKILMRFGKVFQQAYTRFLDLQTAEAQAREAQIEAALERVRSKTMAMHNSNDVSAATTTMFTELEKLGIENFRGGITIIRSDQTQEVSSITNLAEGKTINAIGIFDMKLHRWWQEIFTAKLSKEDYHYYFLEGKEKEQYRDILNTAPNYLSNPIKTFPDVHTQVYFFGEGAVWTMSLQPHSEEDKKIMKRFASVFNLTYRRYQDLQKAEAQAREAQIEAALERVRARTMAMQKSVELLPTAEIMFGQLKQLGAELQGVAFAICDKDSTMVQKWTSIGNFSHPYNIEPGEQRMYEAWKNQSGMYEEVYEGEKQKKYYELFMEIPEFRQGLQKVIDMGFPIPTWQKNYAVPFKNGYVLFIITKPFNETKIFLRFGKVFEQTYTRFLDLQKAEAQAREAKIEAAMEKVRARAMAMQKADELIQVAQVLRTEMDLLGMEELETSSIYIHNETTGKTECWYAIRDEKKLVADHMIIDLNDTWVGRQMMEFYRSDKKQVSIVMQGANRKEWINYCSEKSKVLSGFYGDDIPDRTYHLYKFSNGYMGAASPGSISVESWDLLQRATNVFSLAYTRFNDLQIAEANTKEAIKQAALDRIRADIAAMRTTKDLDRITPLIWNELNILRIPFIRCGVFIMDDEKELIHTFLSTPDGRAITAFHLPYSTPGNISLVLKNWQNYKSYIDHWDEQIFMDFAHTLVNQGALSSVDDYMKTFPAGGFYLHFLPFLQGMLYVGNTNQLSEEEINLVQSLADAFSTAYSRYEDFSKLEAAKKQVDSTLSELQATQKQLIQSEKMASLGELTAGIAHEIQNPLNFVNNFSEVSTELVDEMNEEITKGNLEDAKEIANDLKQNLEKINHHGKRAGDIVKGMLQHSRTSTGQKEPTDINALCDEYLRLAYHGLRAKDKTFNAKFETEFDNTLPKVNVVPQDIGRVVLNLINNSFYAVNEKKKSAGENYEPTVTINTKKINDKVEIKVSDNGNGIPKNIVDKIFQPFFTTKPTGSGTGLGLSLSYDIIKAHGGEIKMNSKEGEGTEFIIQLPVV